MFIVFEFLKLGERKTKNKIGENGKSFNIHLNSILLKFTHFKCVASEKAIAKIMFIFKRKKSTIYDFYFIRCHAFF